ncbi:aminoglycoside phosphotransferase family protein [Metabacillus sp. GX 13764]|uniref:aminoglycoside phosphotransferase family protein n=1 Tax=Metabacillus kandeliae TaxID=2900151 RepID=UPI001E5C9447|nr:aminoglycoside phosphotransferase family protein [Metabacillus kandeliae]MCD7035808.1 aminoglycoside phosphotransferase family protein [Metabacillus kandeliae]
MPHYPLSYNFAAPVKWEDGKEAVLKLSVPGPEFQAEEKALRVLEGDGMVKLLESDLERGILLLERLSPGTMLSDLENEEITLQIAADVMKRVWKKAPFHSPLPSAASRIESLETIYRLNPDGIGPISKELLGNALYTFQSMHSTREEFYLLHGDLHHFNILQSGQDSWHAIDPKGLTGEREYDLIQFLLNRLPENEDPLAVIRNRAVFFSEALNLNKERILSYGFCHSVLAAAWSVRKDESFNKSFFSAISAFQRLLNKEFP